MPFFTFMTPLAEKLRPQTFEDVVGQSHLVGEKGFLKHLIAGNKPLSLLFWGPPGCGKTTLARLYAQAFDRKMIAISALFTGVADLKKIFEEIASLPLFHRIPLLFVDEIHRFNKAQQDAFLPYVEQGRIVLVGATTENPSYALNNALLSRLQVLEVHPLSFDELNCLLEKIELKIGPLPLAEDAKNTLIEISQGDARALINLVESMGVPKPGVLLSTKDIVEFLPRRVALFDRNGDQHYNLISALHKSVRRSDPDASLYWFARMLEGGEDPLFIARRLMRMAVEDIGLADPQALSLAVAAKETYEMLGSPEGDLALAETIVYLALAPKSNAIYKAFGEAQELARKTTHLPPPKTILNAPTGLMKNLGYGKGYLYDHDMPEAFSGQDSFPEELGRVEFYTPVERGFEREMKKRLIYFESLRKQRQEIDPA